MSRPKRGAAGFALIVAILALLLLTFLGLTLAATTSTELQIATNYRWGLQAYYNAEAGLEVGKILLREAGTASGSFAPVLYAPRGSWTLASSPADPSATVTPKVTGANVRNFQSWQCDGRGNGIGYGIVLANQGVAVNGTAGNPLPMQDVQQIYGKTLNGAFTLWVRRPATVTNGTYSESTDDGVLILTSEGVAPYTSYQAATARNLAVRVLEATVAAAAPGDPTTCETQGGQAGRGGGGSGFAGCGALLTALGGANIGSVK